MGRKVEELRIGRLTRILAALLLSIGVLSQPALASIVVPDGTDCSYATNAIDDGSRVFTHFTDEAGAMGISGTQPLSVGETVEVGQLTFAKGENPFIVGEGRIGVTDLGLDATPGQLERIGVFGGRQEYGIQFSELDAWNSGARVMGNLPSRNIYSIPGGCTITGTCLVTRIR